MFSLHPIIGYHTTLSTHLEINQTSDFPEYTLYILYTIPPHVIVDPFELNDNHASFKVFGKSHLELPLSAVNQTATYLLLSISPDLEDDLDITSGLFFDIPLHVRYGLPSLGSSDYTITIDTPKIFRACHHHAAAPSQPMASLPDIVLSSLSSLTHLEDIESNGTPSLRLTVPLGNLVDLPLVETGTVGIIILAFLWLIHCSRAVSQKLRERERHKRE
ncbi:PIG-X [Hygrophoropsis aurantiaca]|uniref:PIG-X n=1 Tax=Hygrophoropsis aurantiaca TaxID=72124 RepID=A0ACB8A460_9AGAM|nr:PIG-X [Hygrophoropsis aurantiaca]